MEFNRYAELAKMTAQYPTDKALEYLVLGLVGEAGEIANKYKKVLRGDYKLDDTNSAAIMAELGDVLWYLAMLANELGYSFNTVAENNIQKLAARQSQNTIKGNGDNR